jgi:glycosyltransferase involved in cell wall biosynthesis
MRIAYLTAGAAGMFCGSCMNDNAVAKELLAMGHDCVLMPVYTPIRTDVEDVSVGKVFLGGINVFLAQKLKFFRNMPGWVESLLNQPWLIRQLTRNAGKTSPEFLGELTLSMLEGVGGNQQREFEDLLQWLKTDVRPDAIVLTNMLIGGAIPELQRNANVWVTLQGDDIFLDSLPPKHRTAAIAKMRELVPSVHGFLCHSSDYAHRMAELLEIPAKKVFVVPLGVETEDFLGATQLASEMGGRGADREIHLGYLARMAPEKGLHQLIDAFIALRKTGRWDRLKLRLAGWVGPQHVKYWKEQQAKLRGAGLGKQCTMIGTVNRQQKLDFLRSIDLFSVPTTYADPKGIFLLEAVASGLPYVMPDHGAFPELHRRISPHLGPGKGVLYAHDDPKDLAQKLEQALQHLPERSPPSPALVAEIDMVTHAKRLLQVLQGKPMTG